MMNSFTELPPPPVSKSGWPWTEVSLLETSQIPEAKYPCITIVTPNYNYGSSLEETIRSVLLQGYPNLEYIVIDGGSTDNSLEVIKKYETWLTYWESKKDRGQSHAINKGFSKASGEIVNWLCSDDILLPGALYKVAQLFVESPERDVVAGASRYIHHYHNDRIHIQAPNEECLETLECHNSIGQPSCFYRSKLLQRQQPVDENLHFTMDHELWCYFKSQSSKWLFVPDFLAEAHEYGNNKSATSGSRTMNESQVIYQRYSKDVIPLTFWYRWFRHPLLLLRYRHPSKVVQALTFPFHIMLILLLSPFYGIKRVRAMGYPY